MRIYFHFNLQTHTLLCHEIAKHLQETSGWHDFAGLVVVKGGSHDEFMRTQSEVAYQYLDTVEQIEKEALNYEPSPERLTEWEQRLDCPLWYLAVADRNIGHAFVRGGLIPQTDMMGLATHENIARFTCYYLDFFEQRLQNFRADAVCFVALAAMPALALAKVCQWMAIPFFMLRPTRVQNRYIMTCNSATERFFAVEQRFSDLLHAPQEAPEPPPEAITYIDSFQDVQPDVPPWVIQKAQRRQKVRGKNWLRWGGEAGYKFLQALKGLVKKRQQSSPHLRSKAPLSAWWLKTRRNFSIRSGRAEQAESARIGQEPYVFFPLHLNPEASTMILAPNFVNQLTVIEALAKNIPLTHKLYVKEHPSMIGRRPRGFYEEIKRFPNVRLISASENSFGLIRAADLISVITGTVGWEAIMMGKPVITFGDCFYAHLGFSEPCSDLNQLARQIRHLLYEQGDMAPEVHRKRLLLFLTALFEHSFSFQIKALWPDKPFQPNHLPPASVQAAQRIADQLAKAINTYYAEYPKRCPEPVEGGMVPNVS